MQGRKCELNLKEITTLQNALSVAKERLQPGMGKRSFISAISFLRFLRNSAKRKRNDEGREKESRGWAKNLAGFA